MTPNRWTVGQYWTDPNSGQHYYVHSSRSTTKEELDEELRMHQRKTHEAAQAAARERQRHPPILEGEYRVITTSATTDAAPAPPPLQLEPGAASE